MGYYALHRMLTAGAAVYLISLGTIPYAAHAGDATTNPMVRQIQNGKTPSKPCSSSEAGCSSLSPPGSTVSGQHTSVGNGEAKKRRPIPRRNFSDSVKNAPEPDCNEMNSGGMLMHGHWDRTKLKCVYDKPTIRFPAPHAKFN